MPEINGTKKLDIRIYDASLKALTENRVPIELAEKVSQIVASDEPGQPNMGRSAEDQTAVNQAMQIFWEFEHAKQ